MRRALIASLGLLWTTAAWASPPAARAPAPARAPAGGGAYGRQNPQKLADTLRSFQMTELLQDLLGSQVGVAAAGGEMQLAEQKVQEAEKSQDPAQRDQLLKEAYDIYTKLSAAKPATEKDRWDRFFEVRMRLADLFRVKVEPLAIRLMYLQGSEEDRQAVAAMTDEPVKGLRDLKRMVDDTLSAYRDDSNKVNMVVYQRPGMAMRERIDGIGAYLKLYRGMALDANSRERKTLLNDVVTAMDKYAGAEDDSEGKFRASLLAGMAQRELGQHDQAAAKLAVAVSEKAPPDVRLQAMFEIVHNRTEQGKFDQSLKEIENFRTAALAILGPEGQLRVDVQATLLTNDLYEDQAAAEKDPARARGLRGLAQKALLDFFLKYPAPEIAEPFLDVVGWKYRDRKDRQNLSGIVLVALARTERAKASDEGNAEALKLLSMVSDANDPVTAAAAPYILREKANLLFAMKKYRQAGQAFAQMARVAPDANQAFPPSLNACVCFYQAYEEALKAKALTADLQKEMLDSAEWLTTRYPAHADTGPWFFILGRTLSEQSQSFGPGSKERAALLRKAYEALEKTPTKLKESVDARFRALEVRSRLLREDPKAADAAAQAQALVAKMEGFAQDAKKTLATAKENPGSRVAFASGGNASLLPGPADKDEIEQWTDWGARAAVGAIQVRYEFLKEGDAAMRRLPQALADWKGSSVAREAMDWEIRMLVESADPAKIAQAITKVDAFRAQYPAEAEGLIRQVVERIQDRIRTLRASTAQEAKDELDRLCKSYLDFSKELFDRSMKADPNQAYAARQMYADALWLGGDGKQSLKYWEECAAEDTRRRDARDKLIDRETEKRIADVTAARRSQKDLERAVAEYLKLAEKNKLDANSGLSRTVQLTLNAIQQAPTPEVKDQRMAELVTRLTEAHKALAGAVKKQTQVDAMNVLGLGRAYRQLKQYGEAMKNYNQLAKGIDRQTFGDFYWDIQLELCQTAREGLATDKQQMKDLAVYIQQLRSEEPAMGGKAGIFNQIESDAKKAGE